jgi:quinolinate synthase
MKMSTPDKVLRSLREGVDEVLVDPAVAERARSASSGWSPSARPSSVGE